ncbi:MAG: adenylate/guanylate cyclase domain-containing protein, partial [Gammaproteobacteria bacterium]|nr:adenylate/guanylate cyclase domain-containing protein [Gammaproteobacteria bacterium]
SATVEDHRGRVMHYAGDAVLAMFDAVVDAVSCATEIQDKLRERNQELPNGRKVQFRIGVNSGDVIEDRGDIYGDGVNVAARLESLAESGGICISESVRTAIGNKLPLGFEFMGEQSVKNIAEPVRSYRVTTKTTSVTQSVAASAVDSTESLEPDQTDKPSIAVLPFTNMSADPEQEYFADGVTEDIITALSNVQSFFVIARNSTFTFKGKSVDVRDVGRQLGVHYVMEGSVRKAGNRVRVTAQLLDAGSGRHIWADKYDGALDDIFDLQDQITSTVIGAIEPHLHRAEFKRVKQKRPENLDAYDYVLRGLASMNKLTPEDTAEALELYRKAIEKDPNYGRAYSCASWCYRRHVQLKGMTLSDEDRDECIRLANAALKADDTDPLVLMQAGLTAALLENDFDTATSLIDRSLSINPNSVRAWAASGMLRNILADTNAAIEHAERAMRLSPLETAIWVLYCILAIAHMQEQRYEDAASWARKSIRQHRYNLPAYHVLAASCVHLSQLDEAKETIQQLLDLDPELTVTRLQQIYPVAKYKNLDSFLDGLRKAGLPE